MEGPAWATNDYAAPLTSHKAPGVLTPIHSHGGQYSDDNNDDNDDDNDLTSGHSWRQSQSCAASPRVPPASRLTSYTPDPHRGWAAADLTPSRRVRPATGNIVRRSPDNTLGNIVRECESPLPVQHRGPGRPGRGQSLQRELGAVQARAPRILRVQHQQQQGGLSPGLSRKQGLEEPWLVVTRKQENKEACEIDILIHKQNKTDQMCSFL